jgi:hypothetical protein
MLKSTVDKSTKGEDFLYLRKLGASDRQRQIQSLLTKWKDGRGATLLYLTPLPH